MNSMIHTQQEEMEVVRTVAHLSCHWVDTHISSSHFGIFEAPQTLCLPRAYDGRTPDTLHHCQ